MSKRFTLEQIVRVLCEADAGCSVQELSERYGFSMKNYQQWRDRLVGSQASLAQRLVQLEAENEMLMRCHLLEERAVQLKGNDLRSPSVFPSWWASQTEPVEWPELPDVPELPASSAAPSKKTRAQKRRTPAEEGMAAEEQAAEVQP